MNAKWLLAPLLLPYFLLSCNALHELELEERERSTLKARMQRLGEVLEEEQLFFVPETGAVPLEFENGDVLLLRYTLYALLGGRELALESNESSVITEQKLHPTDTQYPLQTYVVGKDEWVKGINRGLALFGTRAAKGWLGIPSRLGYGAVPFGRIPSNTPLLFHFEIVSKQ